MKNTQAARKAAAPQKRVYHAFSAAGCPERIKKTPGRFLCAPGIGSDGCRNRRRVVVPVNLNFDDFAAENIFFHIGDEDFDLLRRESYSTSGKITGFAAFFL